VNAYVARFKYLGRFYTQATSEAWKCRRYEEGLRHELKKIVAPMCIRISCFGGKSQVDRDPKEGWY